MEDDHDMMETYDGSTESDDDRLLAPLGESYDALVPFAFSIFRIMFADCIILATCPIDQGQD